MIARAISRAARTDEQRSRVLKLHPPRSTFRPMPLHPDPH